MAALHCTFIEFGKLACKSCPLNGQLFIFSDIAAVKAGLVKITWLWFVHVIIFLKIFNPRNHAKLDPSCFNDIVQATFKPPKAIRGGIPICFPQVCTSHDNISVFHDCFHHDNTAFFSMRIGGNWRRTEEGRKRDEIRNC